MADRDGQEREALAKLLHETVTYFHPGDEWDELSKFARTVYEKRAEDWLKAHDAEVAAGALREAADEWENEGNAIAPRLGRAGLKPDARISSWLRARADESNPR